MAYATSNPPKLLMQDMKGNWRMWLYQSTDAPAVVDGAGYFSDGYDLGMRAGDLVIVVDTDGVTVGFHFVNAATTSLVDLADVLAVTATDTD